MSRTITRGSVAAISAAGIFIVLGGGIWIAGLLAPSVAVHIVIVGAYSVCVAAAITRLARRSVLLARVSWTVFALTLVAVVVLGAWLSRPVTVSERVEAVPRVFSAQSGSRQQNILVSEGKFTSLAHHTSGAARVIRRPDGTRVLTLTGFRSDSGPDLYVVAVPGRPTGDDDVNNYINLGRLKGASGNQQYELPQSFDPDTHATIYIWCRAFTVGFGRAQLA